MALCPATGARRLLAMKAIKAGISNAWPFAVLGFAFALNLVWIGLLACALFTLAQLAL